MPISLDTRYLHGLDRAKAHMEKYRNAPLKKRTQQALLEGGRLMVPMMRSLAPVESAPATRGRPSPKGPWAKDDGPGQLRGAIRARLGRSGPMVAVVGPTHGHAPHRHLVIHGHRVYSHGRPTAFRTSPNDFVNRTGAAMHAQVVADMKKLILDTGP